jgi:hypothetical protein
MCMLACVCVLVCKYSVHYQEYLVGLINRYGIDPVEAMSEQELVLLLQKNEKNVPRQQRGVNAAKYRLQLQQVSSQIYHAKIFVTVTTTDDVRCGMYRLTTLLLRF